MNLDLHFKNFFDKFPYDQTWSEEIIKILVQTKNLPIEFSYFLTGIEFDILAHNPSVDYFCSASKKGPFVEKVLAKLNKSDFLFANGNLLRETIYSLCKEEASIKHLQNVWFEFDNIDHKLNYPSIFLGIKNYKDKASIKEYLTSIAGLYNINAIKLIWENQVFQKLIDSFIFSHIGIMLRRNNSFRLFFTDVKIDVLDKVLRDSGYLFPSLFDNPYELYFDNIALQINNPDEGIDIIGLECYIHSANIPVYRRKIKLMKQWLRKKFGDCNIDMIPDFEASHAITNYDIKTEDKVLTAKKIEYGFHHIKFNLKEDRIDKVKAYIWFENKWEFLDE